LRKLVAPASAGLLLALLVMSVCVASLPFTPHEDPAAAQETMEAFGILTFFSDVFRLACLERYGSARELLASLDEAYIPSDLRYIILRLANLTSELLDVLEEAETTLSEARALLDQMLLSEAKAKLERAGFPISKAAVLLDEIEDAVSALCSRLGMRSPADNSARARLAKLMQELRELLDRYKALLEELRNRASELESGGLSPTNLTLACNVTRAFVGSPVELTGLLTSPEGPLPGREVTLLMDGHPVGNATTGPGGSYRLVVRLSYIYVGSVSFSAIFAPKGEDVQRFLGSSSPTVTVKLLFFRTYVDASILGGPHPGLPIRVVGQVRAENHTSPGRRLVKLSIDGQLVAQGLCGLDGAFSFEIRLASNMRVGAHELVIAIEANRTFSGTSKKLVFQVSRIPVDVVVGNLGLVLTPSKVLVQGQASSRLGPVASAQVVVRIGDDVAYAETREDGGFVAELKVELGPFLVETGEVEVLVRPREPWLANGRASAGVVKLNVLNVGLLAISCLITGTILYPRLAPRREKPVERVERPGEAPLVPLVQPSELVGEELSPPRAEILKAYFSCVLLISERTGLIMEPHMTLREFLSLACSRERGLVKPFTGLTSLAERALYSPHEPSEQEVREALELSEAVRQVIT